MHAVPMTWKDRTVLVSVMYRYKPRVTGGDWILIIKNGSMVQHVDLPTHGRDGTEADAVADAMKHLAKCGVVPVEEAA